MHISLTDALNQYIRDKVASGLYNNASEVVREALRRQIEAEQTDAQKLDALRREIQIGIDQAERGAFVPYEINTFLKEMDAEWDAGIRE